MDTLLIVSGVILILAGIVGCIAPFLPGPPLAYLSLILLQVVSYEPFTGKFLIIWALVTMAIVAIDYYIPILGTKKSGGTKGGQWGATIGLVAGLLFFPPLGLIIGSFAGAFVGEILNHQNISQAIRSAIGSFVGFVAGTFMKLIICIIMGYYFFAAIF